MSITTTYDLLVTAAANFKADAEAADASTAIKSANRDLAVQLAYQVEAAIKNQGARVRERASTAGQ